MELFRHNDNRQTDGLTELFLKSLSRLKRMTEKSYGGQECGSGMETWST